MFLKTSRRLPPYLLNSFWAIWTICSLDAAAEFEAADSCYGSKFCYVAVEGPAIGAAVLWRASTVGLVGVVALVFGEFLRVV